MADRANPYPLRLDDIVREKAKYIAKENGRSLNKEIEILLKQEIKRFETENGSIPIRVTGDDEIEK